MILISFYSALHEGKAPPAIVVFIYLVSLIYANTYTGSIMGHVNKP